MQFFYFPLIPLIYAVQHVRDDFFHLRLFAKSAGDNEL